MFNIGDEVYIGLNSVSMSSLSQWYALKGTMHLSCPCHWKRQKGLIINILGEYCFVANPGNWADISIFYWKDLKRTRTAEQIVDDFEKQKGSINDNNTETSGN